MAATAAAAAATGSPGPSRRAGLGQRRRPAGSGSGGSPALADLGVGGRITWPPRARPLGPPQRSAARSRRPSSEEALGARGSEGGAGGGSGRASSRSQAPSPCPALPFPLPPSCSPAGCEPRETDSGVLQAPRESAEEESRAPGPRPHLRTLPPPPRPPSGCSATLCKLPPEVWRNVWVSPPCAW